MSVGSESIPRVIAFDDSQLDVEKNTILALVKNGAEKAGWETLLFTNADEAMENVDPRVRAIVTTLGNLSGVVSSLSIDSPASPLIQMSTEEDIPIAILSGHPNAREKIRSGSLDTVIDKTRYSAISDKVADWLFKLTVEQ